MRPTAPTQRGLSVLVDVWGDGVVPVDGGTHRPSTSAPMTGAGRARAPHSAPLLITGIGAYRTYSIENGVLAGGG